ncbi:Putative glycoside hydrolase superfamily [Septoria linicola]|uniref:Glycoside hydrolase superfamily n=1 Tax=Septoria linicola TaxID=215465 RepID=A0A9Q9AGR9_9PEZI|nr:putative glycoside hydrolase superfamily [Septoria linicola]USW47319.1 Putative glycoside hydrolase superfamily [Septoria linicola]
MSNFFHKAAEKLRSKASQSMSQSEMSSKRGLCWPVENKDALTVFTRPGSQVSWIYNWSPQPTQESILEFIPMQWNNVNLDELRDHVQRVQAKAVLGFNEPELADQSNMSAELAANEWLRCIEPLRKAGVRAGSPGISNAGHAVGYLQDFLQRIRAGGSDVDFYCLHWYGEALGGFYDYIWSTHHQLGPNKPVWITEFAATNWNQEAPLPQDHVEDFARQSVKYLDTLDWVERYCWFGPMRDTGTVGKHARMFDDEGKLTALGKAYRDE